MDSNSKVAFSKNATLVIKGFLIIWLIFHHAMASKHFVDDGSMFVYYMSKISARGGAVVAAFALLSGFGLNETYKNWVKRRGSDPTLLQKIGFAYSRILKLLVSLWIVFIIFVGAILLFKNPNFLSESYEGPIWLGLLKNLSGNLIPVHVGTVNASWWFVRAILSFYLIFPFVKCVDKRFAFTITVLTFVITVPILDAPQQTRIFWYFQFFLGYFLSEIDFFEIVTAKIKMPDLLLGSLLMFVAVNLMQFKYVTFALFPLWGIFIVLMIYAAYELFPKAQRVWKAASFVGKYSSDMYLLHVFVHGTLLTELVFMFMNPIWIAVTDTVVCLAFSILLGELKKRTGLTRRLVMLSPDKREK